MATIFGFEINRKKEKTLESIVAPKRDDGAIVITGLGAGFFGTSIYSFDQPLIEQGAQILQYRQMAQYPEIDRAVEYIINEAIVIDDLNDVVTLNLDRLEADEMSDNIKEKVQEEFDCILNLLDISNNGYELFRNWYVDGQLVLHKVVDKSSLKKGIQDLRRVDPRSIQLIRNIIKKKDANGVEIIDDVEEFYLFDPYLDNRNQTNQNASLGGVATASQKVKIEPDAICRVTSGILDESQKMTLSYLFKAVRPLNQLRLLEDALVIYRIVRAPERRVFNVDVGGMPPQKAEAYIKNLINEYRSKITYNATTGEVMDQSRQLAMVEDFWLPKSEDGKGTTIDTLSGGQTLGQIEDVQYFQKLLYYSLNVPINRMLADDSTFDFGRSAEISRQEVDFAKFVTKLRRRFSGLFVDLLKTQLTLKGIMNEEDFEGIQHKIGFDYNHDNYYDEIKNAEVWSRRLELLGTVETYQGRYFSKEWINRNILFLTEEESAEMQKQIDKEAAADNPAPITPDGDVVPTSTQDEVDDALTKKAQNDGNPFGNNTSPSSSLEPQSASDLSDTE